MSKRPTEDYIRPTLKRGEADMMRKITGSTCNFKIGSRPRLTKEEYDEFMQWRYDNTDKAEIENDDNNVDASYTTQDTTRELKRRVAELEKKEEEYNEVIELTKQKGQFELIDIVESPKNGDRETVAIAQLSDWHIDEVVQKESVMGLNEFNLDIAQARGSNYFVKLNKLITHHQQKYNIKKLFLLLEGDFIGAWIHDELQQTNSLSPNEGIYKVKNILLSGFKYLNEHLNVEEINVICVCGNHPRETKKIQFSNFSEVNKEFYLYLDLSETCKLMGLDKFKFNIPKSDSVVIPIFGKNYLVTHGHQFKYSGGIGGIFPSMFKWFSGMNKIMPIKTAFIGHWHQSIFTNNVIVNNSLKGYDAYAMSKALEFSRPSQNLILLDSEYGICNLQQIFL